VSRRFAVVAALAGAALLAVLAFGASSAPAFREWQHNGALGCSCHGGTGAGDESCTESCHTGFVSVPDRGCASCHVPGEDTSSLASSSAACAQDCHLYDSFWKMYIEPYAHGTYPHDGASGFGFECLDCHATSAGIADPGDSPHHDGDLRGPPSCETCHDGTLASLQVTHDGAACTDCHEGMNFPATPQTCTKCHAAATFGSADCLGCHEQQVHNTSPDMGTCTGCHTQGFRQHAGKVACATCHTNSVRIHHATATTSPRACRSCHPVRHARKNVANARCAGCHRGTGSGPASRAQHSTGVTKRFVCTPCHRQKAHASAVRPSITCRTCHKGKYHAAQRRVPNSRCVSCHRSAPRHAVGFSCLLCHKRVVHRARP
jgi:hypothetical protein